MTSSEPVPGRETTLPVPQQGSARVLTRQEARDRLLRLCEAVLRSMVRRRMH